MFQNNYSTGTRRHNTPLLVILGLDPGIHLFLKASMDAASSAA